MRINTNISAMNTYGRLTNANASKSGSLAKLSSGLRINKAGDDAAGLSISEKMKSQIGGLKQATRNAQDGVSLIQTAEGALNETHAILGRMRDLATQGANGTLSQDDRAEINKEFDALKEEITRISDTTEFNTKKLLNTADQKFTFQIGANGGQTMAVKIDKMDAGSLGLDKSVSLNDTKANIDSLDALKTAKTGAESAYKSVAETLKPLQAAVDTATANLDAANETKAQTAADLQAATDARQALVDDGTAVDLTAAGTMDSGVKDPNNAGNYTWDDLVTARTTADTAAGTNVTTTTTALSNANSDAEDAQTAFTAAESLLNSTTEAYNTKVSEIDTAGRTAASDAIATIDAAIKSVSAQRSDLGAAQNRLGHTVKNLTTTQENLSEANSRIRDVDMAEEMMEFTKNNILSQAATSMLSQANAMPNSVLGLLQG